VKRDQKFFDMYTVVLGVLILFMMAIFILAMKMSDLTQYVYTTTSEEYLASVNNRLRPFGDVYISAEDIHASQTQVAEVAPAEPVETSMTGPQVFNSACIACHGSGIAGAPMLNDADNWAPRIAQGMDVIRQHAINGFTGSVGYMPPKGARMDLSDEEVYAAVDYMLGEVPD